MVAGKLLQIGMVNDMKVSFEYDRSELKPCPFCGGHNLTSEGVTNKSIFCVDCGAYGPEPAIDTNEVDVDWNTRVEIHKPVLK